MGTVESRSESHFHKCFITARLAMRKGGQVQKQAGRLQQVSSESEPSPAIVFGVGRTPAGVTVHTSSLLTGV